MKIRRLGVIGAESSHSWSFARLCNVDKAVSLRVTHLWGETADLAKAAAEKGKIPQVVKNWRELAGAVDGVLILHRDGSRHAAPARYFLRRRIPVFIDKPITLDLEEGRELLSLASQHPAPLLTFSVIPLQTKFQGFVRRLRKGGPLIALHATGPCDLEGSYGGIFFYGIHLVDSVIEAMGTEVNEVFLQRCGSNGIATLIFSEGRCATVHLLQEATTFRWQVLTNRGTIALSQWEDPQPYLPAVKTLEKFFHSGLAPFSRTRMLVTIAVLEALNRSLSSGRVVKVPSPL